MVFAHPNLRPMCIAHFAVVLEVVACRRPWKKVGAEKAQAVILGNQRLEGELPAYYVWRTSAGIQGQVLPFPSGQNSIADFMELFSFNGHADF